VYLWLIRELTLQGGRAFSFDRLRSFGRVFLPESGKGQLIIPWGQSMAIGAIECPDTRGQSRCDAT
jgi:hypothetical protein